MMKVLVLTNSIKGLYNFRRELISRLMEEGAEITISAPEIEDVPYFKRIGCKLLNTTINKRGTNPITDVRLLLEYLKIVRTEKPNVVLTYTIKPNVYGGIISRLSKVPYIPNITGLGSAVEKKGFLQMITLLLYKVALKNATYTFFQNNENKNRLINKGIIKGNYKVIPGSGVNLQHFYYMDYPNTGKIEFLFIGRIMKEKGIDQYLEVAEFIKNKYPNTVFHIIGSCEEGYQRTIEDMVRKGTVLYHGRQDDVREFHKIAHCTIHPTYYPEGMSNVLLESAACGRPVITTDRAGCKEIVEDGINGFLVEQRNSKDLIDKVEKFIQLNNRSREEMGIAGRKKVEREFDRQFVINEYIDIIKKRGGNLWNTKN
jgi:glycosyltransferase involved in cell wall biosynthesis